MMVKEFSSNTSDLSRRFPTFAFLISLILPKELPRRVFYQTKWNLYGMPLLCIADEAYGVIALGRQSFGIFTFGVQSTGCFAVGVQSIGFFSFGVLSIGFFFAFGVVALSAGYAFGVYAVGSFTLGLSPFGIMQNSFGRPGIYFHWQLPEPNL